MKIIAVDPDPTTLMRLSAQLRTITPPGSSVECFCDPLFAHQYSFYHKADALFAVAQMARLSGLELAKTMRERYPTLHTFLLWPNDDYRQAAALLNADGYLITPLTTDALQQAMEDADDQHDQ